jgi:AraC family transcriptional regulator of adaptative response/methylated-DNA-[protein]-cysteine methyltransferase
MPLAPAESPYFELLKKELTEYFAGERKAFTVPLVMKGSEFQERTWRGLLALPYGQTKSYAELARDIGAVNASRAVGHANGLNRIAILVPCHRVINADGELGGYGGGLWRKRALLELERGERRFSE